MSDAATETGRRTTRGRIRSIAAAVMLAVGIGFSVAAFAVNASASSPLAKAQCRINFQASSLHLQVGQDLVLSWVAVGADKLSASWTSGYVPFTGAVTTTMNRAGTFSYQLTGTTNGTYCGGAGVEVAFAGDTPSHAATNTASSSASTASGNGGGNNGGGNNGGGNGGGNNGGGNNGGGNNGGGNNGGGATNAGGTATGNNAVGAGRANNGSNGKNSGGGTKYPAQSPTGGSGLSWYTKPLNLLAVGGLALLASLALWKREDIRAPFVHRH